MYDDHSRNISEFIKETCNFKNGDTVMSKKTGLPAIGKIVGCLNGPLYITLNRCEVRFRQDDDETQYFVTMKGTNRLVFERWSDLYKDWMFKPVYYVKLDKPQKVMSFDEFIAEDENCRNMDKVAQLEIYNKVVPQSALIAYPEDDLELYE